MQLSPQTIQSMSTPVGSIDPLIFPFREPYRDPTTNLSGGVGAAGYDVHMADELIAVDSFNSAPVRYMAYSPERPEPVWILPPRTGCLAVTEEKFCLPNDVAMHYYNKSTLARKFMNACATLGEPGWSGHLTLELYNQTDKPFELFPGQPIGQVVFITLDNRSARPYAGKYQNQGSSPEKAR